MIQDQINHRLRFFMRRIHRIIFEDKLATLYGPDEVKDIFASMRIRIHAISADFEVPISQRLQFAPRPSYGSTDMLLDNLERRVMQKATGMHEIVVIIPESRCHHSRFMVLYVIEALLYDVLMMCYQHDGLTDNVEQLATKLAHFALFGEYASFERKIRQCRDGKENMLQTIGRLHDDPMYDLPLAPALTYYSMDRKGCQCAHIHYEVDDMEGQKVSNIIKQHHFGHGNLYQTGIYRTVKRFLANRIACMDYNRWQHDNGTLAYAYTIGKYQDEAMARQIHPVPNTITNVLAPLQRVAVIAQLT